MEYGDWVSLYRLKRHVQIVYDVAGVCAICSTSIVQGGPPHEDWCPWPGISPLLDRDWAEHWPTLQQDDSFKLVYPPAALPVRWEEVLEDWGRLNGNRDSIIREAHRAGISKARIHQLTKVARSTIDRVLEA